MAYPGKPKYARLEALDDDCASEHDRSPCLAPACQTSRRSLVLQTATLLVSIALLIAFLTIPHGETSTSFTPAASLPKGMNRVNPSTAHQLAPCGTTAATARANGCIFDLLTMAWLPTECVDGDLSAEFLEAASEPFYYDAAATRPIADYVALSAQPVGTLSWTTRRYHIFHCAYAWRLMHKTLERGGMLESGLSGYHHTEHCTDTLMNTTVPMDAVITKVEMSFPDC